VPCWCILDQPLGLGGGCHKTCRPQCRSSLAPPASSLCITSCIYSIVLFTRHTDRPSVAAPPSTSLCPSAPQQGSTFSPPAQCCRPKPIPQANFTTTTLYAIMAGFFRRLYDWLLRLFWSVCPSCAPSPSCFPAASCRICCLVESKFVPEKKQKCLRACLAHMTDFIRVCRATEMDITMIGLQNAGKTSLLRVLAVSVCRFGTIPVQRRGFPVEHPSNRLA